MKKYAYLWDVCNVHVPNVFVILHRAGIRDRIFILIDIHVSVGAGKELRKKITKK